MRAKIKSANRKGTASELEKANRVPLKESPRRRQVDVLLAKCNKSLPNANLDQLADCVRQLDTEINHQCELASACVRNSVELAIECGKVLVAAKDKLKHGTWSKWLKAKAHISQTTACRYMILAKFSPVKSLLNCPTLADAYKLAGYDPHASDKHKTTGSPPAQSEDDSADSGQNETTSRLKTTIEKAYWHVDRVVSLLPSVDAATKEAETLAKIIEPLLSWYEDFSELRKKQQSMRIKQELPKAA